MWFTSRLLYYFIQEIVLKASSAAVQDQWHQKLRELLETLQPMFEPQGGNNHANTLPQPVPTTGVHANVTRVSSRDNERSSPLAKMTRIFEPQNDEMDSKVLPKVLKRKTL